MILFTGWVLSRVFGQACGRRHERGTYHYCKNHTIVARGLRLPPPSMARPINRRPPGTLI